MRPECLVPDSRISRITGSERSFLSPLFTPDGHLLHLRLHFMSRTHSDCLTGVSNSQRFRFTVVRSLDSTQGEQGLSVKNSATTEVSEKPLTVSPGYAPDEVLAMVDQLSAAKTHRVSPRNARHFLTFLVRVLCPLVTALPAVGSWDPSK